MARNYNEFPYNVKCMHFLYIYPVIFFTFTFIYILSFKANLFSSQEVLFYRGIILLVITFVICSIGEYIYYRYKRSHLESLCAALIVSAAINLTFFIIFPVTFERSITTFLLMQIKENSNNRICKGVTEKMLEKDLVEMYVLRNKAVEKRLKEQEIIRTIRQKHQCIELTTIGDRFIQYIQFIQSIYD